MWFKFTSAAELLIDQIQLGAVTPHLSLNQTHKSSIIGSMVNFFTSWNSLKPKNKTLVELLESFFGPFYFWQRLAVSVAKHIIGIDL